MKFIMNGKEWTIKETSQEKICEAFGETPATSEGVYYGLTIPEKQEVWLWEEIIGEQKRKTLIHELTHCYIFSYITFNDVNFCIDDFCDINANSHDIIHQIVEDYFKGE